MSPFHASKMSIALAAALAGTMLACVAFAQPQSADLSTGVDTSIRPGDDFFGYANNRWLAATTRPDGVARIDTSSMLRIENARRVRGLIEEAAAHPSTATASMVGNYYATWADAAAIDTRGLSPLAADLATINAITNRRALATYLGQTVRLDDGTNQQTESLWGVWIHQGFHDPDHYAVHLVQGGLGLPDADDYGDPAAEHAAHRNLYRTHIANALRTAGYDQAETRAERVLDLEIAIAATHASRADTDDVFKTDNTWRRSDFNANAPGLDWDAYFSAAGISVSTSFVVWQPQSVIGGAHLAATQPLEAWKDYLAFHIVEHYAAVLPSAIANERLTFEALLSGAAPPSVDRSEQAFAATEAVLGDAVGRLYVERYFSPHARDAATAMVENIRTAYRTRLANVTWMAPATRTQALAKLETLRIGLGYPANWIDYSALRIVRGEAFGNLQRVEAFTYRRELAKLSHAVDPDEWPIQLHPQMVGAILNISPNSMQFAAGLFQPPYFDADGDAASNYGSAGAGLAHEITHTFDAVSNLYDAQGRLAPWWTPEDQTRYQAASGPLAAQLNACCPTPETCAHGAQILGESAADLAGLAAAHDAYLLSLHGRPDVVINGLTGEQRFFIAFAQRWRRLQSDDALHQQLATDTHAPPQCRSDLVRNSNAWIQAFGVRSGDRLYLPPEARIQLW